jgi:hypothetical protein
VRARHEPITTPGSYKAPPRWVKTADIDDNADPQRLARLDLATRERLTAKYETARQLLGLAA